MKSDGRLDKRGNNNDIAICGLKSNGHTIQFTKRNSSKGTSQWSFSYMWHIRIE